MKKLSLRSFIPNLITFISLTLGLSAIKFAIECKWEIAVALVVFSSMHQQRVQRYLITYNALITACEKGGKDPERALDVFSLV